MAISLCLLTTSGWWAWLAYVVPRVEVVIRPRGYGPDRLVQALLVLDRVACSPVGWMLALLVAVAWMEAWRRSRTRPVRYALEGVLGLAFTLLPIVAVAHVAWAAMTPRTF
jgi:hypothetical protein